MPNRPDIMGVADPPDTAPMQGMTDALRGLSLGTPTPEYLAATVKASAEMMELMIDWLCDQHRMILRQVTLIDDQNTIILQQSELIDRLNRGGK